MEQVYRLVIEDRVCMILPKQNRHLYEYKTLMFQNYGAGVQACYRGPRLYDTPETKQVVTEIISWYKKYRRILNSDIIHLRKPDARDWDGLMHVDPKGKEKGLAMFFNPTDEVIIRKIQLPLYYTGLTDKVMIREQEGKALDEQGTIRDGLYGGDYIHFTDKGYVCVASHLIQLMK